MSFVSRKCSLSPHSLFFFSIGEREILPVLGKEKTLEHIRLVMGKHESLCLSELDGHGNDFPFFVSA